MEPVLQRLHYRSEVDRGYEKELIDKLCGDIRNRLLQELIEIKAHVVKRKDVRQSVVRGTSVDVQRTSDGRPTDVRRTSVGRPWDVGRTSVGRPWDVRGTSIGRPMDVRMA